MNLTDLCENNLSSSGLDIICLVTSQFTKLFYCGCANIAHIQSGDTLDSALPGNKLTNIDKDDAHVTVGEDAS